MNLQQSQEVSQSIVVSYFEEQIKDKDAKIYNIQSENCRLREAIIERTSEVNKSIHNLNQ
jgi:hypothetical protein